MDRIEMNHFSPGGGPFTAAKPLLFDLARRGYDRDQVERRLADFVSEIETYRELTAQAEQRLAEAVDEGQHGFGDRVERMLRLAEREAAEIRAKATEDATAMVEQARIRAESLEREAERNAAAVHAEADQRGQLLEANIRAHQTAMDSEISAARKEAGAILTNAERAAAGTVERAEAHARGIRASAERSLAKQHEQARGELGRLTGTRDGVCSDLARLQSLLGQVLATVRNNEPEERRALPSGEVVVLRSS